MNATSAKPAAPVLSVAHGSNRRSIVERRFHELAVKEALGTATPEEVAKLDRYQRLRRELNGTAYETVTQARQRWENEKLIKAFCRFTHSAGSNGADQPRPPRESL